MTAVRSPSLGVSLPVAMAVLIGVSGGGIAAAQEASPPAPPASPAAPPAATGAPSGLGTTRSGRGQADLPVRVRGHRPPGAPGRQHRPVPLRPAHRGRPAAPGHRRVQTVPGARHGPVAGAQPGARAGGRAQPVRHPGGPDRRWSTSSTATSSARTSIAGLAQPMITHVAPSDLDFQTVYDIDRGSDIRFDADYAHQQIIDAMTAAGRGAGRTASGSSRASQCELKLIARVEDERRQIGDLVASELKDAGFEVAVNLPAVREPPSRRCTPSTPRRSSGTSTPRAGAVARPSATTTAPSTP